MKTNTIYLIIFFVLASLALILTMKEGFVVTPAPKPCPTCKACTCDICNINEGTINNTYNNLYTQLLKISNNNKISIDKQKKIKSAIAQLPSSI